MILYYNSCNSEYMQSSISFRLRLSQVLTCVATLSVYQVLPSTVSHMTNVREGGNKGEKEGWREGGREGGRDRRREGGRE